MMLNTVSITKDFKTICHSIAGARQEHNEHSKWNSIGNRFHWTDITNEIMIPEVFEGSKCVIATSQNDVWHKAVLYDISCRAAKAFNPSLLHAHGLYSYGDLVITGACVKHSALAMLVHPTRVELDTITYSASKPSNSGDSYATVHVSFHCADCGNEVFAFRSSFAITALDGVVSKTDYAGQRERYEQMANVINTYVDEHLQPPVMGIIAETVIGKRLASPRPKYTFKTVDNQDAIELLVNTVEEALKTIDHVVIHQSPHLPGVY